MLFFSLSLSLSLSLPLSVSVPTITLVKNTLAILGLGLVSIAIPGLELVSIHGISREAEKLLFPPTHGGSMQTQIRRPTNCSGPVSLTPFVYLSVFLYV